MTAAEIEALNLLQRAFGADWYAVLESDPGGALAYVGAFDQPGGEPDHDTANRFIDRLLED